MVTDRHPKIASPILTKNVNLESDDHGDYHEKKFRKKIFDEKCQFGIGQPWGLSWNKNIRKKYLIPQGVKR